MDTLSISGITFQCSDQDYTWAYQESTVNAALALGRSRFGTAQTPGYPSTVSPKYLWVVDGAFLTNTQANSFRQLVADNLTSTYAFTDDCLLAHITGSPVATTVWLQVEGNFLSNPACAGNEVIWQVAFTAIEV